MRTFQDVATVYFRVDPKTEGEVINEAYKAFAGYITLLDAYLLSEGEAVPVKALTMYSERRQRRELFDPTVERIVQRIAKTGPKEIFVVINGTPAVYEIGKDYEPPTNPTGPKEPSQQG